MDEKVVYVIIPVYNRWHFTKKCLESLHNQSYKHFEIVVVDHGSTDGTSEFMKVLFPRVTILNGDDSMWWAAATNFGVEFALKQYADYVVTLNNDLEVESNYLESLVSVALSNLNTIVGSTSVDISNPTCVVYAGTKWNGWLAKYSSPVRKMPITELQRLYNTIETDLLPGRGTLIPTAVFTTIGLFDEKNFPHYAADEDFSASAKRAGFNLLVSTDSVVYSYVDQTGIVKEKISMEYLIKVFGSIKSPKNLRIRWRWALKHSKTPAPFYFIVDFLRLIKSVILK